jgi:diguanylate cyclase (GGDEF)-like protein
MNGRTRRTVAVGGSAWFALLVVALLVGPHAAFFLLAALTTGAAAVVVRRRVAARPFRELRAWRWFTPVGGVLAAGFAVEALIELLHPRLPLTGLGLALGTIAACVLLYEATQYWNRYGLGDWDPGEWMAGIAGLVGATSLTVYLTYRVLPAAPDLGPPWRVAVEVLLVSALVVMALTAMVMLLTAHLLADWRSWTLVGLLVALAGLGVARYLLLVTGHRAGGALTVAGVLVWVLLALLIGVASAAPRVRNTASFVSSRASTVGALVVVVGGGTLIVLDALAPSGQRAVPVLAALCTLIGCLRLLRVATDLADLASARTEARTDGLTGIPNRRALLEHLDEMLVSTDRAALLMIDLDDFKGINDGMGHAAGDELIRVIATRLSAETGAAGLLARLGGDEFAVALHSPDPEQARRVADGLLEAVRAPVTIDEYAVRVDASIGVASTRLGAATLHALLRGADAAMYTAKRSGGGVQVYDEAAAAATERRRDVLSDLRTLLVDPGVGGAAGSVGALVLHYQPQVSCTDGAVVGVEALVRWDHPRHGLLGPAAFLDLVEDYRLMPLLTRVVLAQATAVAAAWREHGWDLPVAVNLSASSLARAELLPEVGAALARAGLPTDRLVLEVTETAIMQDPAQAVATVVAAAGRGLRISIDDYGTGYSSLSYLDQMPAHELKLDRSFTSRLLEDERTRVIVAGTITLAHRLGLTVTAEGVEDAATEQALRGLGCDRSQGYLHARPLPVAELRPWLAARCGVVEGA